MSRWDKESKRYRKSSEQSVLGIVADINRARENGDSAWHKRQLVKHFRVSPNMLNLTLVPKREEEKPGN